MSDETPDNVTEPAGHASAVPASAESPEPGGTVTAVAAVNDGVPPAGEDIHLPGGTPIPLVIAFAVTLMLVGTTASWTWTIIGGIVFVVALGLWIRDSRNELHHLPDDLSNPSASSHH